LSLWMSLISAFSRWTRLRIASLPFSSMSLAYPSSRRSARFVVVTLGTSGRFWETRFPGKSALQVGSERIYGTFTESWLSVVRKLILAVRSSLSQAKR
jgi:hypothetical protein